jgi:hypothetical protein
MKDLLWQGNGSGEWQWQVTMVTAASAEMHCELNSTDLG